VTAQYNVLLNFNNKNGAQPDGSLTLSRNKLYGTSSEGGPKGWGTVFSIDTDGSHYKDLLDFSGPNGAEPFGSVTLSGNKLYGMTSQGGTHGYGIIFCIDTDGSHYRDVFNFDGTTGEMPNGSLTISGNKLYGMTFYGGANGWGVVFSVDTGGNNYKDILDFNPPNGEGPMGSLTLSGIKLYGMTEFGGKYSNGLIFSIDTNGSNYKEMLDFNGTNGALPFGSFLLSGNRLYGITSAGGSKGDGNIFFIDTSGKNYKDLFDFNGTNGEEPFGSLTLSGNTLHGTTTIGGAYQDGNLFSIDTNGNNYQELFDFDGANGKYPSSDLTLSGNKLYGVAGGGVDTDGLVFSFYAPLNVHITGTSPSCQGNNDGETIAYASEGKTPYSYKWAPGGSTKDTLTGLSAGTYTVTVTDSSHSTATSSFVITQPTALTTSIGAPKNILCNGGIDSATVNVNGGTSPYSYAWLPSGGTNAIGTGLTAGTYTVTVRDSNNCSATSSVTITQPTAMVITKDSINVTDASVCNGGASLTVSGGTIPYKYIWSPGGGTNDTISGRCANYYCCRITDHHGCMQNICVTILDITGTSTIISPTELVNIYPNPSNGVFQLEIRNYELGVTNTVEIYNVLGEQVYSQFLIPNSQFLINLSSQPDGVYLYRVITETGNMIGQGKLVIEK